MSNAYTYRSPSELLAVCDTVKFHAEAAGVTLTPDNLPQAIAAAAGAKWGALMSEQRKDLERAADDFLFGF